jgi:hypothetical protein
MLVLVVLAVRFSCELEQPRKGAPALSPLPLVSHLLVPPVALVWQLVVLRQVPVARLAWWLETAQAQPEAALL